MTNEVESGSASTVGRHCARGLVLFLAGAVGGCARGGGLPEEGLGTLVMASQTSGTTELLQAVSPVTEMVVWVSGHGGTWGMTIDGGGSWTTRVMPGADSLQFRDVDAFDERTAYLMSSGLGELSRIYRTDSGGAEWRLQYTADHPDAFLDCMAFWDRDRGVVYGDAVDGVPFVLRTSNGGEDWRRVPREGLPVAQEGEGGFAASGSCVATAPGGSVWIAMGNAERARVLRSTDYGSTWEVADAPVVGGSAAGLTTIGFVDGSVGFALGGRIGLDTVRVASVALTADGGVSWSSGGRLAKLGPAYGAAAVPGIPGPLMVAVGPGGLDWSRDGGMSWTAVDTVTYWAAAFVSSELGWAVGPEGRIARLVIGR